MLIQGGLRIDAEPVLLLIACCVAIVALVAKRLKQRVH